MTVAQLESDRFTATKFRDGLRPGTRSTTSSTGGSEALRQLAAPPLPAPVVQTLERQPSPSAAGPLAASELLSRLQLARAVQVSTAPDTVLLRMPDGAARAVVDVRVTPPPDRGRRGLTPPRAGAGGVPLREVLR